jgi:hypothetical protein
MTAVGILLVAVALVLLGVTGCQAEVSGQPEPEGDGFVIKDGSRLRFRPVLTELPGRGSPPPILGISCWYVSIFRPESWPITTATSRLPSRSG